MIVPSVNTSYLSPQSPLGVGSGVGVGDAVGAGVAGGCVAAGDASGRLPAEPAKQAIAHDRTPSIAAAKRGRRHFFKFHCNRLTFMFGYWFI